jgi:site-specific DNA-methyltransferase (adenine-specific)
MNRNQIAIAFEGERLCRIERLDTGASCTLLNAEFGRDNLGKLGLPPRRRFDLIFTSPPYADLRTYGGDEDTAISPDDYPAWVHPKLMMMAGLLAEDGNLVINLNERIMDGAVHPCIDRVKASARAIGLRQIAKPYIWFKTTGLPSDGRVRAIDRYEYCFWYSNGRGRFHRDHVRVPYAESTLRRVESGPLNPLSFRGQKGVPSGVKRSGRCDPRGAIPHNVLMISPEANSRIKHPAPFPIELARWFILAGSQGGEWVLDPFMGSGTTAIAALEEGRNCVGVELVREYWEHSIERILKHFEKCNGSEGPPEPAVAAVEQEECPEAALSLEALNDVLEEGLSVIGEDQEAAEIITEMPTADLAPAIAKMTA